VMRGVSARAEGFLEGSITIEAMAVRAPLHTLLQLSQALIFRRQRWNDRRTFVVRVGTTPNRDPTPTLALTRRPYAPVCYAPVCAGEERPASVLRATM